MFKLSSEFKSIPEWFKNFEPKKLIDHPVESIKFLIWIIQLGALLGLLFAIGTSFFTSGLTLVFIVPALVISQVLILGLHHRSKLSWLFLASGTLQMTLSVMFIGGLVGWYLLDRDDTITYFKGSDI